jgi:hypothetical protein
VNKVFVASHTTEEPKTWLHVPCALFYIPSLKRTEELTHRPERNSVHTDLWVSVHFTTILCDFWLSLYLLGSVLMHIMRITSTHQPYWGFLMPNPQNTLYTTPKHCKLQDSDSFHNFLDPRETTLLILPLFTVSFSKFVSVIHHHEHPLLLSPLLFGRNTTPAQFKFLPVVTYLCTPGTS